MVTPAARREAVAQLRVAYEVSERRACSTLGADRASVRYRSLRPDDAVARARLRELGVDSPPVRLPAAAHPAHTRRHHHEPQEAPPALPRGTAAGAPTWRAQACARHKGADDACRKVPISAGAWTFCQMLSVMADGSAFWRSSTTSRGNAWRWCPIPRCPGCGSCASSTPSSLRRGRPVMCVSDNGTELTGTAILRWSQETRVGWHYIAPASRSRMRSSRASTDDCVTSR
jgi:putative transposase